MGIPGTGGQLLILLLFVLPGTVYQTVRSRLRGPIPSDNDATGKILRALTVSTLLNAFYLSIFGTGVLKPLRAKSMTELEKTVDVHQAGWWALLYLVMVPAGLALFGFWASRWEWPGDLLEKVPAEKKEKWKWVRPAYHPTPGAWDFAFTDIEPCYVRIQTADGNWYGGWFGRDSLASSFPESPAVFIERPWFMTETGEFKREQKKVRGTWVRCDDARRVEFVDLTGPEPENDEPNDASGQKQEERQS